MAGIASTFAQAGACHDPMSTTDISIFLTKCYETLPAGQANRTSDLLDRDKKSLPGSIPIDSTPWVSNAPQEATLERFAACFEGLEDPRSGNAALHDFPLNTLASMPSGLSGALTR
jgi:hypothetical protein